MFKKLVFTALCTMIASSLMAAEPTKTKITYGGSGSVADGILKLIKPGFEKKYPAYELVIEEKGLSGNGAKLLNNKNETVDIGGVARELKSDEKALGYYVATVAYDPIVVIVSKALKIKNITKQQLNDIYTGKTTNWKDLGEVIAQTITPLAYPEGAGTNSAFQELAMNKEKFADCVKFGIPVTANPKESQEPADIISGNPYAIGFVSPEVAKNPKVKILTVDGITGNAESIKAKTYPLVKPLNLIIKTKPADGTALKALIDYIFTDSDAQKLIATKFVPEKQS